MALGLLNMLHLFISAKCVENVANFAEIDCRDNGLAIFKTSILNILTAINRKKKSNSTQGYSYVIDICLKIVRKLWLKSSFLFI